MPAADALFDLPEPEPTLPHSPVGWPEKPIGKVIVESGVPHLDRVFDYLIPVSLDEAAQPGVRVKIRFGPRQLTGWLIERTDTIETGAKLVPISSVVSALPILRSDIAELAAQVAAEYSGTVSDVLRNVVPARVARVEREVAKNQADIQLPDNPQLNTHPDTPQFPWDKIARAEELTHFPSRTGAVTATLTLPSTVGEWGLGPMVLSLAQKTLASGRSTLVVVPDNKMVDYLFRELEQMLTSTDLVARLTSDQGPTARYRSFLSTLLGEKRVVIGTRSAIWAPLKDLGTIIVWDDADELLVEPRAPYYHVGRVARLRAEHDHATVVFASTTRSIEVQRLVEEGQALELDIPRPVRREVGPRVISTADSFHAARDPLAQMARLPSLAWRMAREALQGKKGPAGPVLVQVARAGFIPGLVCERCRTPARCKECNGPLAFPDQRAAERFEPACRWCGTVERHFSCGECGHGVLRAGARGVDRTAEELGRAFPMVPVLSSSADHMLSTVEDQPAVVVATVGAEPFAAQGYAAALLLDGDSMLQREGLQVPETVLGHWIRAATLVRPATQGGTVVVTASNADVVGALVRLNPMSWAQRELSERLELNLPPVARVAEVTGSLRAVRAFIEEVSLPYQGDSSPWVGPTPLDEDEHRALLFFPHHVSADVAKSLRDARAIHSAQSKTGSVRLRLDPIDIL